MYIPVYEGWWPDWNDSNQGKWYNWFWMDRKNGFAFGVSNVDKPDTTVGSRLCFCSEKLAQDAAKQKWISDLYEEYFT